MLDQFILTRQDKYLTNIFQEYPLWLENALKSLPDKTASGNPATTLDQLHDFHKKATK